jgi:hypothetical protein|nr:MAG TPA: acyl-CoA thioesterase [Caudoviricetes sp.]
MTTYTKTDHYALNLYGDTDPADLRDGYNGSMHILDTTLETHLTRIEGVESRETHNEEVVRALLGDNTVDAATTAKTKWDNAATGATDSMTALTALGTETAERATTAKAKWDKASADAARAITDAATATGKATANTDALSALGAETAAKAATAKAKWDRASTEAAAANLDIARILRTLSETNGHLVTFGDSYGINSDKTCEWPTVLNSRLGEDSVLHNYCVAGSGYIAPNSTYQSELVTAKADASYDHSSVGLVVIAGSRNSNDGYSGTLKAAATTFYADVRREYPNARIITIPVLWDWTPVSNYWRYNSAVCLEAARETGIEAVPWAWTWNLGNENFFASGDIHPNATGTDVIVSYMLDYIHHNYTGRTESWSWRDSTNVQALFTVNATGGLITYGWNMAGGVTPANFTTIKNALPKWAERNGDTTNEPRPWCLMASNAANEATLFKVDTYTAGTASSVGIQPFTTTGVHGTPNGLMGGVFTMAW